MDTLSNQNASTSHQRGHGRQCKGRQIYQRGRVAQMGCVKGAETVRNVQDDIHRQLFVGSHEEDTLDRLSEQQTLKAITLSITTRGIGLGICHLTFISI